MATVKKKTPATAAAKKQKADSKAARPAAPKKAPARKKAAPKAAPRKSASPKKSSIAEAPPSWMACVRAAEDKKADAIAVLDLREVTSMADFFLLCNGTNPRQNQAIADEIEQTMKLRGEYPSSVEGYENAEWILLDYGDLVCHVFTEQARGFYDLDRLWRDAKFLSLPPA